MSRIVLNRKDIQLFAAAGAGRSRRGRLSSIADRPPVPKADPLNGGRGGTDGTSSRQEVQYPGHKRTGLLR